jgi:CRISPR-associated endoribonuclease Cas6
LFHLNNINIRESYSVLKIRAITPLRIKYNRDLVRDIEFHILIRSLLRRLSLIYYFHIKPEILIHEPKELIRKAETVKKIQDITFWYDWERYSSRQDKRIKLGGVIGEIIYKGNISIFIPYVKAGEILHVGKGTSFGLGKYEIVEFST